MLVAPKNQGRYSGTKEMNWGKKFMDFDTYQSRALSTADYPGRGTVSGAAYASLGLAGEAGEVANKVKKIIRDDALVVTDERRKAISKEIGDCLWYAAALADEMGLALSDVAAENLRRLKDRKERGVIKGEGDER